MRDRDAVIGRIVDREDTPADWADFAELAATDSGIQTALVETLCNDAVLRAAVADTVAVADRIDVDAGRPGRRRTLVHWGGWLAAAALALCWLATEPRLRREPVADGAAALEDPAGVPPSEAQPAGERFVRDLPHLMVEARPIPGSDRTEVLYVRRTLERRVVSGAYTMATDEIGRPVRVKADLTRFTPKSSY